MADLDGNTWYQITESRVNYTSALFSINGGLLFKGNDSSDTSMYWQIYKLDGGNFQFRNQVTNIKKQLGVCYVADEASNSKTEPCMQDANASPAQRWSFSKWDDGTYKITNVANGTGLHLDWHPGGPGFMSPTTAQSPKQPAQHWMFKSLSVVEDGVYSTSVTPAATSASATSTKSSKSSPATVPASATATNDPSSSATPQKSSSSSGLSSGAAAGIGIGVAVVVIALAVLAFFLIRKRKRTPKNEVSELPAETGYAGDNAAQPGEKYAKTGGHEPIYEAPSAAPHQELYTPPAELPAGR